MEKCGFNELLVFTRKPDAKDNTSKKNRKREIICFFALNVNTFIGSYHNSISQNPTDYIRIFNKNTVKVSYLFQLLCKVS